MNSAIQDRCSAALVHADVTHATATHHARRRSESRLARVSQRACSASGGSCGHPRRTHLETNDDARRRVACAHIRTSDKNKQGEHKQTFGPMSYELLISSISEVHARTQAGAAGAVNRYLTLRNWYIGAYIVEFEQNGEDPASYGQQLLPRLARDLKRRGIAGCSAEMLGRTRVFIPYLPAIERKRLLAVRYGFRHIPCVHRSDSDFVTSGDEI